MPGCSRFMVQRLRVHLIATAPIQFPSAVPANALRGAFGAAVHSMGPSVYERIFSPRSQSGPSGLRTPPRPFAFRAANLSGRSILPGSRFHFDLNIFGGGPLDVYQHAFGNLHWRARSDRIEVMEPVEIALDELPPPLTKLRVDFLTPTELKAGDEIAREPTFAVLFARARDRIATLAQTYGRSPLDLDFRVAAEHAAHIRMSQCRIRTVGAERRSFGTGQIHPLGGFIGSALYEGALAEFIPFLRAAELTGVGRHTVWGKGEIALSPGPA